VHPLAAEAQNHWRKLNGCELLANVIGGVRFEDGVEVAASFRRLARRTRSRNFSYTTFDNISCPASTAQYTTW
jgi:hypothetical protein